MQTLSAFFEMGVNQAWIVLSPSISSDVDDDQSDSVSVISESDRENVDSVTSSKYFWDSTHLSLSKENSSEEHIEPDSKIEEILQELSEINEEPRKKEVNHGLSFRIKQLTRPSFWIALLLISNLCVYSYLESGDEVVIERLQLAESQNKHLRLEINTLRKIIFLMNVDENPPTTPKMEGDGMTRSKDVKIYEDETKKKFICIGVKKFIDIL